MKIHVPDRGMFRRATLFALLAAAILTLPGGIARVAAPGADTAAPAVLVTSPAASPVGASPIPVTVTFSEPVTGFGIGDMVVRNGTAGNFAGSGAVYTADITPAADGTVTVGVAAAAAADPAGNPNTAAVPFSIVYAAGPISALSELGLALLLILVAAAGWRILRRC